MQVYPNKPSDPSEHILPNHKTPKRWYVTFGLYILILAFISGSTFGAGFLTATFMSKKVKSPIISQQPISPSPIAVTTQHTLIDKENPSTISAVAQAVTPSIVTIINYPNRSSDFFLDERYNGMGSGVIFKADEDNLYIVTNHHVIAGSNELDVVFYDASIASAKIIGYSSRLDIAVLSVPLYEVNDTTKPITIATLGDSDAIQIGEPAIAIGNPLGPEYSSTITSGIISAIGRRVNLNAITSQTNLIQTDAAINPGNSGGALLNIQGEVIGINSIKYVDESVEGIGFAIPINDVKKIIDLILKTPEAGDLALKLSDDRAFLGVEIRDLTPEIYTDTGMRNGVYITSVLPNSSAQAAGIQKGDIIYLVDKQRIHHVASLLSVLEEAQVGNSLQISLLRDGEIVEVTAVLTSYKDVMSQQDTP